MITIPSEKVLEAFQHLPKPVREYLAGTELLHTVTEIGTKNGLHVDVTGQLSTATTYMVLGLLAPLDFATELKGLGIPDAAVQSIISDVNLKIFIPLQQKMREPVVEERAEEEVDETATVEIPATVPSTVQKPAVSTAPASTLPVIPPPAPLPQPVAPRVPQPELSTIATAVAVDKDAPVNVLEIADPALKTKIALAHQSASAEIKALLTDAGIAQAVRSIRTGHKLPPEIASDLGSKVGLLLLDVIAPVEFRNQLLLAGTAVDTAEKVVQEIQAKIISHAPAPTPATPVAPSAPAIPTPPAAAPVPRPVIPPAPPAPAPVPTAANAVPAPVARTMATDMQALMHPEMTSPARTFQTGSVPMTPVMPPAPKPVPPTPNAAPAFNTVPSYTPPASGPAASFVVPPPSASVPPPAAPVAPRPVMPPQPAPAPHSTWTPPPATDAPSAPGAPIVKQYGVDPYRELPT